MGTASAVYQCVHCGSKIHELYRDFKKGVIKISHCAKCNEVADKYIEYDSVIIFLDVLLLQTPAYRHILINAKFKGHWRLLLVLWLCDALTKLMQRKAGASSPRLQPDHVFYSALEFHFYQDYLLSAVESLIFFCAVVGFVAGKHWLRYRNMKEFELESLLRAVTLSSMGRLLVVPALIWGQSFSAAGVTLTHLFVAASNVQALRVVNREVGGVEAVMLVLVSYVTQALMLQLLTVWVPVSSPLPFLFSDLTHCLHWT